MLININQMNIAKWALVNFANAFEINTLSWVCTATVMEKSSPSICSSYATSEEKRNCRERISPHHKAEENARGFDLSFIGSYVHVDRL